MGKEAKEAPLDGREAVLGDFRNFLYLVWKHLNLPDPTPVQYDMAEWIQHAPRRCIFEAFRGVGKSWITSAFVVWTLLNDPQKKILVVSASKERADSFSIFTKRIINELSFCRHLQGGERQSNIAFDVGPAHADHAPSVKSIGITGQLTGSRADIIIADDVETPANSYTQTQRDKISECVKEFDAVLKPGGRILFLGTPQTEMSLYNILRDERGYTMIVYPARVPTKEKLANYKGTLAPYIERLCECLPAGSPTDPLRFDDADLKEREGSYGRTGFALQFMLDTTLSDRERFPLKLHDFIVYNVDREKGPLSIGHSSDPTLRMDNLPACGFTGDAFYRPMFVDKTFSDYEGKVLAIDPSGRGLDETAYAVVYHSRGRLWIADVGGLASNEEGYSKEVLSRLASIASLHQVNAVVCESNLGGGMFVNLLTPILARLHPCEITEVTSIIQKERRIADTLEPLLNQHRLVVSEEIVMADLKVPEVDRRLFHQLTRLTRDRGCLRFDDRLDALAMACGYWVAAMKRDEEEAVNEYLDEQLMASFESVLEHGRTVGGAELKKKRPEEPNWINTTVRRFY